MSFAIHVTALVQGWRTQVHDDLATQLVGKGVRTRPARDRSRAGLPAPEPRPPVYEIRAGQFGGVVALTHDRSHAIALAAAYQGTAYLQGARA